MKWPLISVKWTFGKMDFGETDFGEMDNSAKWIQQNVPSAKCSFGEMSLRRNVLQRNGFRRNVP
jgi:hypothetical protein